MLSGKWRNWKIWFYNVQYDAEGFEVRHHWSRTIIAIERSHFDFANSDKNLWTLVCLGFISVAYHLYLPPEDRLGPIESDKCDLYPTENYHVKDKVNLASHILGITYRYDWIRYITVTITVISIVNYGDRLDFNRGEVQSSIQFDLGKLNSNFDESPKKYEINWPAVR